MLLFRSGFSMALPGKAHYGEGNLIQSPFAWLPPPKSQPLWLVFNRFRFTLCLSLRYGQFWSLEVVSCHGGRAAEDGYDETVATGSYQPYSYPMPSIAVNSSGDMFRSFSGSRGNERIGAFYSGRRASGTTPSVPVLLQAGRDFCNLGGRWGDYTYTTLDPSTGKFWTIQEYAEQQEFSSSIWGTWVTCVKPL
jgi:hypothetical protein